MVGTIMRYNQRTSWNWLQIYVSFVLDRSNNVCAFTNTNVHFVDTCTYSNIQIHEKKKTHQDACVEGILCWNVRYSFWASLVLPILVLLSLKKISILF